MLPGYEGGWTQDKQWEREMNIAQEKYGPIFAKYAAMPIEEVAKDEHAMKMGSRMFATYCSICHGSDAKGALGFPNLADNEWRWGGDPQSIETTILGGRHAIMAAWGDILGEDGVKNVAAYVRTELAGLKLPEGTKADVEAGKQIFSVNCVACHGPEGKGTALVGAPNLTNPGAFIYGSSYAQLQQTIRHGRQGQMPAQEPYLGKERCTSWPPTSTTCRTTRAATDPSPTQRPPGRGSFPVSDLSPRRRDEVSHQRTPFLPFLFNRVCCSAFVPLRQSDGTPNFTGRTHSSG